MSLDAHAEAIRRVYPTVLAKLLGMTRSLADAEDAVHDAIERALQSWGDTGAPDSPEAWLVTVAQNAHRDRVRRARRTEAHADAVAVLAQRSPWARVALAETRVMGGSTTSCSGSYSRAATRHSRTAKARRSRSRR